MSQTILYYPTIDIQDGQWLRNAILYWDKIASVVPYENYSDFSPEVCYLRENKIYEPIFPQDLFFSKNSTDFINAIIQRIEQYTKKVSQESYSSSNIYPDHQIARIHKSKIDALVLYELLHYNKIPSSLYEYLKDEKLVGKYNCDGWLEINSHIAEIYMRTFAEYATKCSNEDMVIGTDKSAKQFEIYNRAYPTSSRFCFSLIMQNCLPQPTMDIGLEDILEFKKNRKDDLLYFRERVRAFEIKLSQCQSPEELKAEVEAFKESWQRELLQMDKLFKGDKISYILGHMRALIEASSSAAGIEQRIQNYTSGSAPTWLFGAVFSIASLVGVGSCYVNHKNKLNEHRNGSGFAYLTSANKNGIILKSPFHEML